MQHRKLVLGCQRQDIGELQPRRRSVHEPAARNQRRRLGEPGRIPERPDLAPRLVARTRTAVETVEGRRMQEQGLHHQTSSPSTVMRPLDSTRKCWSRQNTVRAKKLATNTAKDKASRTGSSAALAVRSPSACAVTLAQAHLTK